MNFITRWFLRRKLQKEAENSTELTLALEQELKDTLAEHKNALKEARTRNAILEARRRTRDLQDEQDRSEGYLEDEDDDEDEEKGFNPEKMISELVQNAIMKKIGINSPVSRETSELMNYPLPPSASSPIPLSPLKTLAIDKIKQLDDATIEKLAKKYL